MPKVYVLKIKNLNKFAGEDICRKYIIEYTFYIVSSVEMNGR